jgi:O-antigen/teichoic acid export membrane protein
MIKRTISSVQGLFRKQLAKDTATMATGQVLRLAVQAVYFVAIARVLGPQQYGAFVAMAAMVGVVVPFAGMGGPNILLKNVSKDRSLLAVYWGNGLLLVIISGCFFGAVILAFGPYFLGRNLALALFLVCVSDLVLARIVDLSSFAFAALGRMGETARLNIYISCARLVGILVLAAIKKHPNVQDWSFAYLGGSFACFLYAFFRITWIDGIRVDVPRMKGEITESSYFAVSGSAATIYNDIDKTMLARLADFGSTGIYGAAYRLIDVSTAPIRAMTAAAYPEFFRRGHHGPKVAQEYAWKLIRKSTFFGAFVFVGLFLGAPILPHVLGNSFRASVEATRWLAVIPLLRSVHLFLGDALSGSGYQGVRTSVQLGVGILNVFGNLYFIAHWTWRGAAWTSVMCDGLLVIGFLLASKWARRDAERTALVGLPI